VTDLLDLAAMVSRHVAHFEPEEPALVEGQP